MTDDGVPLTRRRILAGIAGAGALGSGAGAFTAATLTDRELLPIGMTAGAAGIAVDCDASDCAVEDGVLQFAFDVVPGEQRSRSFTLTVDDNPVRVWARTDCPPEGDADGDSDPSKTMLSNVNGSRTDEPPEGRSQRGPPGRSPNPNGSSVSPQGKPTPSFADDLLEKSLEEALELRVSVAQPCGAAGTRLYPLDRDWGTLQGFQTAFADGRRLDVAEPCFESGDDICLELAYRLPQKFAQLDDEADLELELYAEQCRHVAESAVQPPFEPADCGSEPDPEPCPDCTELGKLEVEGDSLEEETYAFDELYGRFEDDEHSYEIDVLDVKNKDGGTETVCAEFALLRDGSETLRMCNVKLKGGTGEWFEELNPPETQTPGELCTGETEAGNSGNTHQPAISHLTVSVCDDGGERDEDQHDESNRGGEDE